MCIYLCVASKRRYNIPARRPWGLLRNFGRIKRKGITTTPVVCARVQSGSCARRRFTVPKSRRINRRRPYTPSRPLFPPRRSEPTANSHRLALYTSTLRGRYTHTHIHTRTIKNNLRVIADTYVIKIVFYFFRIFTIFIFRSFKYIYIQKQTEIDSHVHRRNVRKKKNKIKYKLLFFTIYKYA